jgi:hypothetical protein
MTEAPQLTPTTGDTARDQRCAVCEHDLADHGPISHRYCRATQAHALSRGCICPNSQRHLSGAVGRIKEYGRR